MNTDGIHSLRGVFGCEGQAVDTRWNSMLFVTLEFTPDSTLDFHAGIPQDSNIHTLQSSRVHAYTCTLSMHNIVSWTYLKA